MTQELLPRRLRKEAKAKGYRLPEFRKAIHRPLPLPPATVPEYVPEAGMHQCPWRVEHGALEPAVEPKAALKVGGCLSRPSAQCVASQLLWLLWLQVPVLGEPVLAQSGSQPLCAPLQPSRPLVGC